MTVTVTDNRTILDQADAITNFNLGSQNTTDYAEAAASVSLAVDTSTGQLFFNGTCPNFVTTGNELIYIWSSNTATQNSYKPATQANASHALWLSDGTNDIIIFMEGNDRLVFKHSDSQVQFSCFIIDVDYLDTVNTNGNLYEVAGSYASFDPTSITEVGAYYVTLSKALAGGFNCFIDIIRYGTEGISITGGTTGARGTFLEVTTEDRAKTDLKAHGIIREYTIGSYGVQGTLKFGTTSTGDSWFDDSDVSITFEDRQVSDDKWKIVVLGNTTGGEETHFYLTNVTIASARVGVEVDMTSTGINTIDLDSVKFTGLKNAINFPSDSASYSHSIVNCIFNDCGQVDPNTATLTDCTFSDSNSSTTGAMLLPASTTNLSGLKFVSGGTGHAIYITATGTYTFTNFTYSGYGATASSDAVILNQSGGSVTINVTGGDTPTYKNFSGSESTTIVASVTLTVTVQDTDRTKIQDVQTSIYLLDSPYTELMNEDTSALGVATESYGGSTPVDVVVKTRKSEDTDDPRYKATSSIQTITSDGLALTVTIEANPVL